jgi:hypothetical protein
VTLSPHAKALNERLDRIQALTEELAKAQGDAFKLQILCDRIRKEIALAKIEPAPLA